MMSKNHEVRNALHDTGLLPNRGFEGIALGDEPVVIVAPGGVRYVVDHAQGLGGEILLHVVPDPAQPAPEVMGGWSEDNPSEPAPTSRTAADDHLHPYRPPSPLASALILLARAGVAPSDMPQALDDAIHLSRAAGMAMDEAIRLTTRLRIQNGQAQ